MPDIAERQVGAGARSRTCSDSDRTCCALYDPAGAQSVVGIWWGRCRHRLRAGAFMRTTPEAGAAIYDLIQPRSAENACFLYKVISIASWRLTAAATFSSLPPNRRIHSSSWV